MPRTFLALLACLVVVAVATGCGGGSSQGAAGQQAVGGGGGDNELSASDAADVLGARRTIDDRCGGDRSNTPKGQTVPEAVQTLVTVTQLYPDRVYETGSADRARKVRDVADQVSGQLRACGIAAEADRLGHAVHATS